MDTGSTLVAGGGAAALGAAISVTVTNASLMNLIGASVQENVSALKQYINCYNQRYEATGGNIKFADRKMNHLQGNICFFKQKYPKCQMIMTSHNTNLMTNRIMRPDCLFILSRKGTLTALCNATERELREGHNLEKMYISGEFEKYE